MALPILPRPVAIVVSLAGALTLRIGVAPAQSPADTAGVGRAFEHYHELVLRMAHDSIAALFALDGELEASIRPPIRGPDSVRAFLRSFTAYQVIADTMRPATLAIRGDTAVQTGRYWQRVRTPAGDTVVAQGAFELTWVRSNDGSWLIRRMRTAPAPRRGH